jgi:hypothetical protein
VFLPEWPISCPACAASPSFGREGHARFLATDVGEKMGNKMISTVNYLWRC